MKEEVKFQVQEEEIDKIHLDENYEVQAWCELFEVTLIDLKHAIDVVGPSAMKVKYYLLEKNKRTHPLT